MFKRSCKEKDYSPELTIMLPVIFPFWGISAGDCSSLTTERGKRMCFWHKQVSFAFILASGMLEELLTNSANRLQIFRLYYFQGRACNVHMKDVALDEIFQVTLHCKVWKSRRKASAKICKEE